MIGVIPVLFAALFATTVTAGGPAKTTLVYANGQKLNLYRPATGGAHPCFIYIHGGSWRGGDRGRGKSFAGPLVELGWTVASIDYRLVDKGKNPFPAQIIDCKEAIRYLRRNAADLGIDPRRICVGGSSAGGHLAALAGVTSGWDVFSGEKPVADPDSEVLAVADMYGPTDLLGLSGPKIAEARANPDRITPEIQKGIELLGTQDLDTALKRLEEASPMSYLSGKLPAEKMPRFLILHSSGDPVVPVEQSERFHAALTKAGVRSELKIYKASSHRLPRSFMPDLIAFLQSVAQAGPSTFKAITKEDKTKVIDDRYPEVKPTREELRSHQEHGYIVCIRGVKSREAADYYRSLGVERFIDADPALWERPKNSIDKAIDEVRKLDEAAEDAWFALKDESAFEARRLKLRADMTAAIGGFPERTPLNAKTTGAFSRKGCRIEKVMFESEPNHHVTAYLFLPEDAAKAPYPAVLVPLGHSNDGKRCKSYFKGGVVAAQAGLAALVYDPIDQGERQQAAGTVNCVEGHVMTGLRASLVGWHGARFRIWDGIRALDYLESRPDIDGAKLAIMGQSGGGTLTSYIAALDTRVKASCPAGFVTTSRDLVEFWGPQDCEQNIPGAMKLGLNHLSLMMMASPRPVALILAEDDAFPPFGSFTTLAKMRELYARLGIPERVDYNIAMGKMHGWYDCSREASVRWVRRWLTGNDAPAPKVADADALPPAENEADAFVVPGGMVSSLPGERATYDIVRTRADALAAKRPPLTRELVAKISRIDVAHPSGEKEDVNCVRNGYWSFIKTPADELACIYDWLGTSIVRTRAERMIAEARAYAAAQGGAKMKLVAKGHEAVAAAHAHYLAPELFSGIEISDPPPSWRKAIDDPNLPLSPQDVVAGAFASYDWTDLLPCGAIAPLPFEMKLAADENWWGLGGGWGLSMPFTAKSGFAADIRLSNGGHPVASLLVSDKGRYIWCDEPVGLLVTNGTMRLESDRGKITLSDGFKDLRGAFLAAAKAHFPASGTSPDPLFFSAPQLNTWVELTYNQNQKDILAYAESMRKNGVKPGVLMIDDTWQYAYGTWEFDPRKFSDPKAMMDRLHKDGYSVLLWTCPFVSMDSPGYRELADCDGLKGKGGFVMDGNGAPYPVKWWNGYSAMLDMTHPEGRAWFSRQLDRLQKDFGVDGFKLDGGGIPHYAESDMVVYDKSAAPAWQSRAYGEFALKYPMSECRALFRLGGQPIVTRLADKSHNWKELNRCVTDMLAVGICGYPFICPDMIGGGSWIAFDPVHAPYPFDEELFVRSAQVHALCPMMQFSKSPWTLLSEKGQDAVRKAVATRQRFADRFVKLAEESGRTGEPMMRYMEYQYPGKGYAAVKDQFMMGDFLIVAPQLVKGATTRTVEIPEGIWTADDGTEVVGPKTVTVKTPLDRLPHFVRKGK